MKRLALWLAAWQGKPKPEVNRPTVCVFAGNHGVAARGVSRWMPSRT